MPDELHLVDAVSATPTVRLDLNGPSSGGGWYLRDQPSLNPPDFDRAMVRTLMTDGSAIPAGAFNDRTIVLPLRCDLSRTANDEPVKAQRLAALEAQLNLTKPVLRWRPNGATGYTFYRLFRSPSITIDRWSPVDGVLDVTATILAEPFGLGVPVVAVNAATVNNDFAAGSNGMFLDVTGITGDVETPAKILMTSGGSNMAPVISVRRHGTVTQITPIVQAESTTLGTDTTSGADSAMSGGNRARCSFATVSAMATRLTATLPFSGGSARSEARGDYRLFAIVASSASSNTYAIRQRIVSAFGGSIVMLLGDTVTYTATDTSRQIVSLGLFGVPCGPDPFWDGYGAEAAVGSVDVQIQAQRVSGSGSLDFDLLVAMPASEELCETATTYLDIVFDGPSDTLYTPGGSGEVTAAAVPAIARVGSLPMLTPNQTNRLYFLRPDGVGTGWVRGADVKTRTAVLTITFNPRYLTWAP
jgi:hypothetical protein